MRAGEEPEKTLGAGGETVVVIATDPPGDNGSGGGGSTGGTDTTDGTDRTDGTDGTDAGPTDSSGSDSAGLGSMPVKSVKEEDGVDVDGAGNVIGRYHLRTVTYVDGSTTFSRTDTYTNGTTAESYGATNAQKVSSYSERYVHADGSTVLITRTTGPDGHGTEHKTWVDADGTTTGDETTDF